MQLLGPGILVGGLLALAAVCLTFFVGVPIIIENTVKGKIQLSNGSELWDKWVDLKVPIFYTFRVFNITNPDAIKNKEKIIVQELGPYVYQETREKTIIEMNKDEDTLTYDEKLTYHFRPDMSGGREEDEITILNAPFVSVATIVKKYFGPIGNLPVMLLQALGETFVREKVRVGDIIFRGIPIHPLYALLAKLAPKGQPEEFVGATFALLNGKNASSHGVWKIQAGVKDHSNLGEIVSWNGRKELPFWTNESLPKYDQQYCNKLNGTDGTVHAPFVKKDRVPYLYHYLLCRSVALEYKEEQERFDIPGYKFIFAKNIFTDPRKNPDNECFCPKPGGGLEEHCFDGAYRNFACHSDAPIVFSKPHYLHSDDKLLSDQIEGLTPNEADHDSELIIEPNSGVLLRASFKVQASIELQTLDGITAFRDIKYAVVPFLWLDLNGDLDDDNIDYVKSQLLKPLKIVEIVQWLLIAVSIVIILVGFAVLYRQRRATKTV